MNMSYWNQIGYKTGNPAHDSYIIKDFQRHAGISADGLVGPITKNRMDYYDKDNYCPQVFENVKPYIPYSDEQIESLLSRGLVGLGKAFNTHSRLNNFDVL